MERATLLNELLDAIDHAADILEEFPDGDVMRKHLPELEGDSGGWFSWDENAPLTMRDEVLVNLLEEERKAAAV